MSLADRFSLGLDRFVRRIVEPRIDFLARYPARVIAQGADGTLEVQPDSDRVPGMTGVPIRWPVPGLSAKVAAGARCLVAFAGGDPGAPEIVAFEGGDFLDELVVTAKTKVSVNAPTVRLADGDIPLARQGDLVSVLLPSGANSGGPIVWAPGVPTVPPAFAHGTIVSGSGKGRSG